MNIKGTSLLNKICAVFIVFALLISDFMFLGQVAISYAIDTIKTNSANVDFSAYFINTDGNKVERLEENIDKGEEYLYVDISVKNEGYFNGKISLSNNNFNIKNIILSENVAEITGNEVRLNQINAGTTTTVKLAIEPINATIISSDMLNSVTKVGLNGQYINSKNVEKDKHIEVSGTADVSINWKSSDNTKLELESLLLTNSIYSNNDEENRVVQILVNSKITNNNYPVKSTNISLNVPKNIKNIMVHSRSNAATNSSIEFNNTNYNYNKEENKLTINVANEDINKVSWVKNVQDSFVITFELNKEDSLLNSTINVSGEVITYDNKILSLNNSVHIDKEIDGIVSFELNTNETAIYKGRLYTGEEREYKTASKIYIDYLHAGKIELNQESASFISENEIKSANIVYEQCKFNKNEFISLFGNDGYITIKDSNNVIISTINSDSQADSEGYVVVNFLGGKDAFSIETSKPVAIGTLNIETTKRILANDFSREVVNSLTAIKENINGKYDEKQNISVDKTIELKNTSSKANLTVSTKSLSSIEENKQVKITAVLLNNDESKDLYQNPIVRIKLPKQIKALSNITCRVLYANGLEINGAHIKDEDGNKVVEINLSGTQQTYNTETLEGTTIILQADLVVDKLTVNSDENIILNYTNEIASSFEDNGEIASPIKIIAEQGVITTNSIPELNIETIGNKGTQNVVLDTNKEEKNLTVKVGLINNEGVALNNVTLLGKIPVSSNLGVRLTSKINSIAGDSTKIYYTDNEDATDNLTDTLNGWTEKINPESVKKYLIVIPNMAIGERFEANYTVSIPANLGYNVQAEEGYKVNYTNSATSATKTIDSTILNLTTGTGAELKSNIKAYIGGKEIEDNSIVFNGEIIKYVVTVKNDGTEAAKNVSVRTKIPENTTYVKFVKGHSLTDNDEALIGPIDYFEEIKTENGEIEDKIELLEIGEEKSYSYEMRINDEAINGVISTEAAISYLGNSNKNEFETIKSNVINNKVNSAELSLNVRMVSRGQEAISNLTDYYYEAIVKNTSNSKLSNISININKSLYDIVQVSDGEKEIEVKNDSFIIDSLNANESKTILIKVNTKEIKGIAKISAIANDKYHSNEISERIKEESFEASMKSSNEGETINSGDSISYNISITNNGTEDINYVEVEQDLSTYLNVEKVTVNGQEIETSTQYMENEQDTDNDEVQEDNEEKTNTIEESESYKIGFSLNQVIKPGESIQINVETTTNKEDAHSNDIHLKSLAQIKTSALAVQTEEINHILKAQLLAIEENQPELYDNPIDEEQESGQSEEINNSDTPGESSDSVEKNNNNTDQEQPDKQNEEKNEKNYTISGTAWLDSNENGSREPSEQTLGGIKVRLLNLDTNASINTVTSENGFYSISNAKKGKYVAIFEYDTEKYMLTTYQAENVSNSRNSDIENVTMNLDGESKKVASTDTLIVNDENITNVDLGLIEAKIFDFSLTKTIKKVTITNETGVKSTEYNDANIAKVEVKAKNIEGTLVAIEYSIKVTNNGEVAGYIKQIVDYKPSDLNFNSSLNPEWYQSGDNLYSTSLGNTKIEAGETKELTLVLTKKMTESNTGLTNNTAEIAENYNSYGIQDIDSTPGNRQLNEDDMGSSNVIISVSTGAAVSYVSLTLSIIVLIAVGTYIISRKILKDNINI